MTYKADQKAWRGYGKRNPEGSTVNVDPSAANSSPEARAEKSKRNVPATLETVEREYAEWEKTAMPGQLRKAKDVPKLYKALHMRAMTGHCSLRQRIKLTCAECMGWSNVREEVRNCTATACSLWQVRPYQEKA